MQVLKREIWLAVALLATPAWAQNGYLALTTFDAPGAGAAPGQGTQAMMIGRGGWIVGTYIDGANVSHGFLRSPDGRFTSVDPPGSASMLSIGGLNAQLTVTGCYEDAGGAIHSFIRTAEGQLTTYDDPGAGSATFQGTCGWSINDAGEIAGYYRDANYTFHSFLRSSDGSFTEVDAPGAGTGPFQGTVANGLTGLTNAGALSGGTLDANSVNHGMLRRRDGTFTQIDAPDAGAAPGQGTVPSSINQRNELTGNYVDAANANHGFFWTADRGVTEFDAPGAGSQPGQGTFPVTDNPAGAIVGWYTDPGGVNHGFVRSPNGRITEFDAPGAGTTPGSPVMFAGGIFGQGTVPVTNNDAGTIAGFYVDNNNVSHGFVLTINNGGR